MWRHIDDERAWLADLLASLPHTAWQQLVKDAALRSDQVRKPMQSHLPTLTGRQQTVWKESTTFA